MFIDLLTHHELLQSPNKSLCETELSFEGDLGELRGGVRN